MKTPLPEDSDLECFLPVNKALRSVSTKTATFGVMFTVDGQKQISRVLISVQTGERKQFSLFDLYL